MKFIDVSSHNGDINWNKVKNSGIQGVIIKATEGKTYRDPYFEKYYSGAKAAGLRVGVYHYLRKGSDALEQYNNLMNAIKGKSLDIKVVLDVEDMSNNWGAGQAEAFCNKFVQKANQSGVKLLIYSGRSFIEENFSPEFCSDKYWWVAEYGANVKTVPKCGTWTAWQYTEKGRIDGVNGDCDVNNVLEPENFFINNSIPVETLPSSPEGDGKIAELQKICGVPADNIWGPVTDAAVKKLPLAGLPYKTPELTTWIQLRLGLNPDGVFGEETDAAVRNWQASHGLKVDGIAGYNTIKSLALA